MKLSDKTGVFRERNEQKVKTVKEYLRGLSLSRTARSYSGAQNEFRWGKTFLLNAGYFRAGSASSGEFMN